MRFVVQGGANATSGSQQVVNPPANNSGGPQSVTFQNVGTTTIWLADSQANLNTSVDTTGTPNYGLVLQPGTPPVNNPKMVGGRWALTSGPSGLLEIEASGC